MSPATAMSLPIRMRIGDGEEIEVGAVTLDLLSDTAQPDLDGVRPNLAALLRTAADAVEAEGVSPT